MTLQHFEKLILGVCLALAGGVLWFMQEGARSTVVYTPTILLAQIFILVGGGFIFPSVVFFVNR